jgi:transcriptional regulator with XRE-family HTH domain
MLHMAAGAQSTSWEKRAFARTLFQLRQERKLTQEALAFESGYHPKYISLLERGKYSPSLTTILELADALRISGADLVDRVEKLLPRNRYRRRDTHRSR